MLGGAPLAGVRVVCVAVYVPALAAAQRLRDAGAHVDVVERPTGDPLALACPAWYDELHAGCGRHALDLKTDEGRAALDRLLGACDVLLTALRPSALARLGLEWPALHERHPRLCHVAIVGLPSPDADAPGHDLTYQASLGLLAPPAMPRTLLADLAGGERAAFVAAALLLARARTGTGGRTEVSLARAAEPFAAPLRHGLTAPGGLLGGGLPGYGLYAARDGWVAVGALEPHFWRRLCEALGVSDRESLARAIAERPADEWVRWARERDLPIARVASQVT